ncbi:MAG TPA: alpha/beta hydrolase [Burkholderiales bacterium]|nr:alpha/beta hydrolase [Burkholderiales bacterium]
MDTPVASARHFMYYPGNYRWSAEMLVVFSTIPYGGAEFSEADRIGRTLRERVGDDDAWFRAWCDGAELLRGRARTAEERGHPLTAASNYLRACFYYQIGDHFRQPKDEQALAAYRVSLDCFRRFAALTDGPRIEVVDLPSQAGPFPAYFIHAQNTTKKRNPCIVRFGGFDTQKEIQYLRGTPELVRRGFNVLLVDGPGQGEAIRFRGMRIRHDFEIAGSAALDYLETRGDVDMNRVAIIAMSLGGYYTPRCAAMDPRYKAAIAWGAIWDYYETWQRRIRKLKEAALPVPADHLLWACGVDTFEAALTKLEGFRLQGIAEKVQCPFLLLHGAEDAQVSMADAQTLFDAIGSKDKTFRVFTPEEGGAQHCQRDYLMLAVETVCDWLEEKFR